MGNNKIEIFYDKRQNFYIKKSSGEIDLLPESFIDFRRNHKKILASSYPHMEKHIMNCNIADSDIEQMISEYNENAKRLEIVRWYKVCGAKLKSIDDEPKGVFFVDEYKGEQTAEDIILFVDSASQELFNKAYLVFECPQCKEKQFQSISKNCVKCSNGCGNFYIDEVVVRKKCALFDSAHNKADAIDCLIQWKKESTSISTADTKCSSPFYFEGNVYRISYADCKNLHHELYNAFAVEEIFSITDDGVVFTQNYKNYLKSLKDYNINPSLYREIKSIENKINSQEYDLLPIDKAFYWYMNKHGVISETKLIWRISDQIICFENKRKFVDVLLAADDTKRSQLINLYKFVASLDLDDSFFEGYDGYDVSLSHLIYAETGMFVYINNGHQIIKLCG